MSAILFSVKPTAPAVQPPVSTEVSRKHSRPVSHLQDSEEVQEPQLKRARPENQNVPSDSALETDHGQGQDVKALAQQFTELKSQFQNVFQNASEKNASLERKIITLQARVRKLEDSQRQSEVANSILREEVETVRKTLTHQRQLQAGFLYPKGDTAPTTPQTPTTQSGSTLEWMQEQPRFILPLSPTMPLVTSMTPLRRAQEQPRPILPPPPTMPLVTSMRALSRTQEQPRPILPPPPTMPPITSTTRSAPHSMVPSQPLLTGRQLPSRPSPSPLPLTRHADTGSSDQEVEVEAEAWYLRKEYNKALELYEKILKKQPKDRSILKRCAECCANLEMFSKAREYSIRSLKLFPDDVTDLTNCAIYSRDLGEFSEGLKFSERALNIDPDHLEALNTLAAANYRLEKYDDSLLAYDRILELKPYRTVTFFAKCLALSKLQRWNEVIKTAYKVLSDSSNFNKYEDFEQYRNQIQRLQNEALKHLSPQQPLPASGQPSLFRRILPRISNADTGPSDIDAHTFLADTYIEKNLLAQALEQIEKILTIDPNHLPTLAKKYHVWMKLKREQEASEVRDTALNICAELLRVCNVSLAKNPNDLNAQNEKAAILYFQNCWQTLA